MKMTIDALMNDLKIMKDEIKDIKEINTVLMNKLDKAYDDRIELRASNYSMKDQLKGIADA
jgi:FtsZ-binding cell division protein ZapB